MNTPTTDFLLNLEERLESDIRECLRLLDLGLEDALRELRQSREDVGSTLLSARRHLQETVEESRHQVEAVQQSLGQLGMALHQFVLTDPLKIEDLDAFDAWHGEVLTALDKAREELGRIESQGDPTWKAHLATAWGRLAQQLEAVRLHLALDSARAGEEMEAERSRLRERLSRLQGEIRSNPRAARETIQQWAGTRQVDPDTSRVEGWLKALMMWIENPPKEKNQLHPESRTEQTGGDERPAS